MNAIEKLGRAARISMNYSQRYNDGRIIREANIKAE
jgi:hypothetical protein